MLRKVEGYKVNIGEQTLYKWGGKISVWDTPQCFADGSKVVDIITEPTEVMVIGEQPELCGKGLQRVKIRYQNCKEGWVLYEAVEGI